MSRNNLEDIYPLAPMQQGILFQTLYASEASEPGAYFVQSGWTLRGDVDTRALVRAFQEVVDRHGALRTAFVWEKLEQPMQVVWRRVKLPVTEVDLRGLPPAEQAARIAAFAEEDRRRGFDLTRAPLLRLAFLRLEEDAYRFLWSAHHLILDGWSNPILLFEVFGLYQARAEGRELRLERARPYGEYIAWLQKQDAGKAEAFWRARLAGLTAPTPLPPGDVVAGAAPTPRFGERRREIGGPLLAGLQELVRGHGLTLSAVLQGAWALLLARTSGEEDVLFGATVSGRSAPVPGIDRMVGMFINTVAVRVTVPRDETVLAWLKGLHRGQGELSELEHTPLVSVQGWSAIPRGTPLFESLVVFENYPIDPLAPPQPAPASAPASAAAEAPRKRLTFSEPASSETPPYPLTLVAALRKTLTLALGFDARRFSPAAVERLLGHLVVLLEGLVAGPERRVGELSPIAEEERRALLVDRNATATAYPRDESLASLFEAEADAHPEAVAVVFGDREITYGELDRRSNQLAHHLRGRGVGAGMPVGLLAVRSIEMVVGVLGILKAGGAYVPLDPDYPAERLAFLLDDAAVKIIVGAGDFPASFASRDRVRLDLDAEAIAGASEARLGDVGPGAMGLAYVMYTSGSTGRPKGVAVPQRAVVRLVKGTSYARFAADEVFLQLAPLAFDASTLEIWGPLLNGGRLVVAPAAMPSLAEIGALIRARGVTTLWLTAGLFNAMVEHHVEGLATLRQLLTGGDTLSVPHVRAALDALPGVTLINGYGPTEGTTFTACHTITRADVEGAIPIGRPIANTRVYLLDDHRALVPTGAFGELYVGGDGLALGYLGAPELTRERFVPSPFAEGERLYRTGDLARWLPDGSLAFGGRRDFQVKIRGFRVELGEIEVVLGEHPAIGACAVLAREDHPGDKRLVAYVVGREGGVAPGGAELSRYLAERLPAHLIPSAFVALAALPITANGKIDRRALPAPDAAAHRERAYVAPRGPVEETLAGIFAEVLKVPSVGAHDGFFELGGHSLLATQAVTRIRGAFGIELPLRALFEAPSPAELAARIAGLRSGVALPPLVPAPRDRQLRLSFAQERLWLVDQIDPGNPAYNVPEPLRLLGPLDAAALERALHEVVRRHEVLRTTLATASGHPVQIIHQEVAFWGGLTDLASLPEAEREPAARAQAAEEARRPFDLARGPLLRARLLRLAAEDHFLLLTMHHVVSDAWTRGIMSHEIRAIYEAFRRGEPSPLPELPIQYADFAEWQRGWLQGEVLDQQLAYWKQKLDGAPLALELPTDRPRPAVQTFRGASRGFALAPETTKALTDLARKEGVTLYMALLTALDLLLYRYTGQPDVVVGTSIAGRTQAETERLVGFFVNALVLRATIDEDATLRSLLQQVRETCLGAYAHQDMPFERLVHELAPAADRSRAPLFQVIFTMQNAPRAGLALPGLEIRSLGGGSTTAKYDLTFLMSEIEGRLVGSIEFNTDLFDGATIDRLLRQLSTLLVAMPRSLDRKIREIGILPEDERARLLVAWNSSGEAAASEACLHDLFEAQVDLTPEALALVAGPARLTYAELDRRANQLAHHLRGLGVGPESVVGLCLDRSAEVIVGLLGILKSGGAYLPLEPGYPAARLAQILGEAGATIAVTQAALAASLPAGVRAILVDAEAAAIAAEPCSRLDSEVTSHNLAYVLFTSGSTGKPKGVAVEHRQLVNYTRGVGERLALPAGSSYAHVSTFAADLGNTVLFPPLVTGGTLHVIAAELTTDPDGLGDYFTRERIDCLKIVPSHLAALLSSSSPARVLPQKLLVLGGEASSWELIARLSRLAPGTRILNHYGPTETTVGVLTHAVNPDDHPPTAIVPLGRPLPGCRVHVLDGRREPTPTGVPGEIYIGGAQVARGYLNQPELTAERFVSDPFTPGARLYRTGDRARYLPDGTLVFLGRADFQVKIRGFRIELGEIEAALVAHPGIEAAVVLAQGDDDARRLAAFVVPANGAAPPSPAELAAFVAERLPEVMVPASFEILVALPLSSNGKIDRAALAAVAPRPADLDGHIAPRTPTEDVLASIWADVFGKERVGIEERFADLGGHSLLAIQIVARARDAFQTQLPLRAIFEHPTIAALALAVDASVREGEGLEAPPITRLPRGAELRLSFAQERLWFLDQLDPGSTFYNVPSAMRVAGPFDVEAMARAFREVIRRHEVLRTTFAIHDGRPIQVIHEDVAASLPVVNIAARDLAVRDAEARAAVREEAARPFDLEAGPMVRGHILRLGPEDHVLLVTMHHIVSDAATRVIFQRELLTLYAAFEQGRPSPLAELPIQYADYAGWQRKWLDGEILEKQLAYWKRHLDGAPTALALPTDRPRPPVQSHRGERRTVTLPKKLLDGLKELSRREGTTLFMTLLAATYALLHRHSGQPDILIGTPVLNRGRRETEDLIGFFVNTLVLRAHPARAVAFRDLLLEVREACLGGYAHQDIPFERLMQALAPDRDLGRSPLFQVMFTLETVGADGGSGIKGLRTRPMNAPTTTSKFDLMIGAVEAPGGLGLGVEFNVDIFDASTIERMLGHFRALLEGVIADPDQALQDLPLLGEAERRRILVEWNATSQPIPEGVGLHQLFEQQVDRTPDAVAVVSGAERITYRRLDAWANVIAHRLAARGVGPGALVGLSVHRSAALVAAMLGILKAGGAYVPLDPAYPRARLAQILEQASPPVILVDAAASRALPEHTAELLLVDESAEGPAPERFEGASTPRDLAYVLFTSGSTGLPKGVAIEHRSAVALVTWARRIFSPVELAGVLFSTSISFDLSIFEVFVTLAVGGKLIVAVNALELPMLPSASEVTLINTVPSAMAELLREKSVPASVRTVCLAGEPLSQSLAAAVHAEPTIEKLYNLYGPTEDTTYSTFTLARRDDRAPTIGRPIDNGTAYILGPTLEPVPIGVAGEIYLGGAGLARGYLHQPAMTSERFIESPFIPGERLYRTGDLGRFRGDGEMEYLGRIDHQIKLRGFRIELGEIESVLRKAPGVRDAVVVAREDQPGDRRLVAYVVLADGADAGPLELRALVKEKLPEYMVPSLLVTLPALPLTANGKVDRAALPAPPRDAVAPPTGTVAPRDALEARIVNVWREVLGVSRVGITDSFFDLGGHSMLAVRMTSELKKAVGRTISLLSLFEAQTIEQIADLLREGPARKEWKTLVPIKPTGSRRPFFLVTRPNANSLGYIALARRLDPDQPVYGLQFQYPEESYLGRPYTREEYEERARSYVEILRAFQPEGPYLLGGMCEGSLLAFVMTRQLEAAGQKVAFLGIMDAWPEENTRRRLMNWVFMYDRKLRGFLAMSKPKKREFLLQTADRLLGRAQGNLGSAGPSMARAEALQAAALDATTQALWAERIFPGPSFVPPKVEAPITVLRVREQPYWRIDDAFLGWRDRTNGGVALHHLDGTHTDFMRPPHVAVLARELDIALRKVHAELDREAARAAVDHHPAPVSRSFSMPPVQDRT